MLCKLLIVVSLARGAAMTWLGKGVARPGWRLPQALGLASAITDIGSAVLNEML